MKMDSNFDLNTPGWFTSQVVAENDFLDDDQFGNKWFNVKFTGDAETFLWLAKEKPEEDKAYYGHLEKTKSGKAIRFKRDQVPDDVKSPTNAPKSTWQPKDEKQVTRNMVWKNLLQHFDVPSMGYNGEQWNTFWGLVDLHTEMLLPKTTPAQAELKEAEKAPEKKSARDWGQVGLKKDDVGNYRKDD
jgi:hypothetical protein